MKLGLLSALMVVSASYAGAQVVGSRGALNSILGASAVVDDFSSYSIANGGQDGLDSPLTSTSIENGQGPNLVHSGASYSIDSAQNYGSPLYLAGVGYYALNENYLLSGGSSLLISFTNPVLAMGFDATDYGGYSAGGTLDLYNGATLVGTESFGTSNAVDTFVGYEYTGGITSAVVTSTDSWGTLVNGVEYGSGSTTPSPAAVIPFAVGLIAAARRRRAR